ncbi:MAG: dTMP kinase [Deltaproteobacteria bacterium HGW-Deltaproteobacteria-4]|nr:MAG: dTMP kinase [Deltaproteobacteria bacterium HGW-Deltaproteobacteria-4]
MAKLITCEGIEGSGKSTQILHLAAHLRGQGREVVVTREPGGCPIADAIRRILLDPSNQQLCATAELLLYAAARAQHVEEVIRPALAKDAIVLCDRYIDATIAYQGFGRGLDLTLIKQLNQVASSGLLPDLTLLFDLPVAIGLGRALARNAVAMENEGRFEAESLAFHQRVRDGYLQGASQEERFTIIDATGIPEQVTERVTRSVDAFLGAS